MRSGTLSDSSVRKFCHNVKRDDTFDVTRLIPATRSSKRAARKALAALAYGPSVVVDATINRDVYAMMMRVVEEEEVEAEEEFLTPVRPPPTLEPRTPITRSPTSTPLPPDRLPPSRLRSNDKRVRRGDLRRTLIDLAITDRRVGLKEGDMLTGLTKSQLKLMIRLIYEGQDGDDDALAEKNISADE